MGYTSRSIFCTLGQMRWVQAWHAITDFNRLSSAIGWASRGKEPAETALSEYAFKKISKLHSKRGQAMREGKDV